MYSFDYKERPADRAAAAAAYTGEARYLAGGQSLVQAMRLRLSSSRAPGRPRRHRRAEGHQGRRRQRRRSAR